MIISQNIAADEIIDGELSKDYSLLDVDDDRKNLTRN